MKFNRNRSNGTHMVGMVVCDKDSLYVSEREAVVAEILLEFPYADALVNEKPISVGVYVIAVSAAAASKTYKFNHGCYSSLESHISLLVHLAVCISNECERQAGCECEMVCKINQISNAEEISNGKK